VADLKGKKVAYVPGGVSQLYWAIAARDAKLKPGDVEEVELPVAESRAAFLSGAVDALVGQHRTFLPLIRDGSASVIASSNGAAPEYRLTFVRPGYLDDKAQAAAVGDFVSRVARSKQWLEKHYPEAADIYQRAAKVEPDDALAGVKEMPATVLPLDDQLAKALQSQAKIFHDTGVTTSTPKISVIFDRRYETG
jgi:ABC-type nitrate/sulfonate/bicarbonate transport system substrate-binding protein